MLELSARVTALEQAEATRSAQHASQLDAMNRLLKRFAQRIVRESDEGSPAATPDEESTMHMRRRLGR